MKALVVCPTYGRIPYLGRMLSCFLNQTYEDKHLVIINDDKNIKLICDYDNVTVINVDTRMTVPDKKNMGISLGNYDIIFPLDDDDIMFPTKIENDMKHYIDSDIVCYKNTAAYILYGDSFHAEGSAHNSVSFTKKVWYELGGYNDNYKYEDVEFYEKIRDICGDRLKIEEVPKNREFVYGFGGVNYHLSCNPQNIHALEELASDQLERLGIFGGIFKIIPNVDQYNNFLILDKLYKETQEPIIIKHISDAVIDISHLL